MSRDLRSFIGIVFCLCAAYGIALFSSYVQLPSFEEEPIADACTDKCEDNEVCDVNKAPPADEGPQDETLTIEAGDTLAGLLSRLNISTAQAHQAIEALKKVFNPKDLKVDQDIYVIYEKSQESDDNILTFMRMKPDIDHTVEVMLTSGGLYEATRNEIHLTPVNNHITGTIDVSLYADALQAGASPKMLYDMIKALSYDVDFQRDIHKGDTFELFYNSYKDEDTGLERPGELLFAKVTLDGKASELYRFQPKGGVPSYYTATGESTKKALLRTPIDGARLSSGFGNRKHPILGYTKMHKGVDFAAPKGTPIMAAGDGVVERASPYSTYGNYIRISHNKATKTAYAHLCRYAKGIKAGSKVSQGQIIGYVGATGRASGPHLHFELIQNGKHVNPSKATQLPSTKLGGNDLKAFTSHKEKIQREMKEADQAKLTPVADTQVNAARKTTHDARP